MMCFKTYHQLFLSLGLVLCLSLLPATTARAQEASATSAESPSPTPKVLSWNVAGGACDHKVSFLEFSFVVNELRSLQGTHNFDVLNLQEVYKDQATRLATELHFDGIRATPYFVPTVRCDNGEIRGNAILSRYRMGGRRSYSLPNSPGDIQESEDSPKLKKNPEYRKLMGATIRVNGRRIRIYNTHLTADGCAHLRNPRREAQAWKIRSYMSNDRIDAGNPWRAVLTGDFNTRPNSYAYRRILTKRMTDAWAEHRHTLEDEASCTHFKRREECGSFTCTRVDYVFYEGAIGLESAGVLDTGQLSDHRPVVVRVSLDLTSP